MPVNSDTLYSLVYISRETAPMSRQELLALLAQSRPKNQARNITGLLVHKAGHFLQVLEGPKDNMEALMATIAADSRHQKVSILVRDAIEQRRFGNWSMALADWPEEDAATTKAWSHLLDEFARSQARFGPVAGLIDFTISLAGKRYLE
ncbi:MAG: BLUF domain-containing protein [Verrucomicrobiales bacterium]